MNKNERSLFAVIFAFASSLNRMMEELLTTSLIHETQQDDDLTLSLHRIQKAQRDAQIGPQFTAGLKDNHDGTLDLLIGTAVVGVGNQALGRATMSLRYLSQTGEIALIHFSVMEGAYGEAGTLKNPMAGIMFDKKPDVARRRERLHFSLEEEAINAEAWKRVRDTLNMLSKRPEFFDTSRKNFATMHRMAPTL